jgi:hypothetical protein
MVAKRDRELVLVSVRLVLMENGILRAILWFPPEICDGKEDREYQ